MMDIDDGTPMETKDSCSESAFPALTFRAYKLPNTSEHF